CTPNPTPVGLGEGAHASLPANVNLTGSPQRIRPVADKMPVSPTAKLAVPRPETFSTVRWCTGLTSDERIPILETKNSSMTSVRVRSNLPLWIGPMDEPVINCARLRSI
ncbi:MAG TPA: hypothetical protein VFO22_04295, partial [Candidatus Udaeobacter sp.]|nr:hypothetical protein [Candidatus Udaeobacter sp.]